MSTIELVANYKSILLTIIAPHMDLPSDVYMQKEKLFLIKYKVVPLNIA